MSEDRIILDIRAGDSYLTVESARIKDVERVAHAIVQGDCDVTLTYPDGRMIAPRRSGFCVGCPDHESCLQGACYRHGGTNTPW